MTNPLLTNEFLYSSVLSCYIVGVDIWIYVKKILEYNPPQMSNTVKIFEILRVLVVVWSSRTKAYNHWFWRHRITRSWKRLHCLQPTFDGRKCVVSNCANARKTKLTFSSAYSQMFKSKTSYLTRPKKHYYSIVIVPLYSVDNAPVWAQMVLIGRTSRPYIAMAMPRTVNTGITLGCVTHWVVRALTHFLPI